MASSLGDFDRKRRVPYQQAGPSKRPPFGQLDAPKSQTVFRMMEYHPVQAGSIDGTDVMPHDKGIKRALTVYTHGLYDPYADSRMIGEPNLTLFIGQLSAATSEDELKEAMERFGAVRDIRLVRDIVTGASQKYAFVEFETYRSMYKAYHEKEIVLGGSKLLVDWNRQRLMPGWIPRRLGGGLGGSKMSGQLRFGGRHRAFRAPLKEIPSEELRQSGIPVPDPKKFQSVWETPRLPGSMEEGLQMEREDWESEQLRMDPREIRRSDKSRSQDRERRGPRQ